MKAEKKKDVKETKESKLVKLLTGGKAYTLKEIITKTGFAEASARMYINPDYLKRKAKSYSVVIGKKGKEPVYSYSVSAKKGKKK